MSNQRRIAILCLLLACFVAGVYLQTLWSGFVFDDFAYVVDNSLVNAGCTWAGVRSAFSGVPLGFWHPLTLISHMLDVSLFGLNPAGHHLSAVLLHMANGILCFLLLRAFTGATWTSALAAALFALHPLRVESVAYVSERKDVLSVLFCLLTIAAWLRHLRRPSVGKYLTSLGLFALGLMAKPMLVTLPFALLLLDFWPLDRFRRCRPWTAVRLVLEKLPFLFLSAAASILAFIAEQSYDALNPQPFPLSVRLLSALYFYANYLGKTLWPSHLAAFYPHPGSAIPAGALIASAIVLGSLSLLSLVGVRRYPFFAVGWLWFLGTMVPVIGLVQIGDLGMADRFTYLPSLGLAIMIAWGAQSGSAAGPRAAKIVRFAAVGIVLALSFLSFRQVGIWRDGVVLFGHVLALGGEHPLAHYGLGEALQKTGDATGAARQYFEVLRLAPGNAQAHNNLGVILAQEGKPDEAIAHFREAIKYRPRHAATWNNLGSALQAVNRIGEAEVAFRAAIGLDPGLADAYNNLGILFALGGKLPEAVGLFRQALAVQPGFAGARSNLERALAGLEASREPRQSVR